MEKRVVIIQRRLTHYRIPLFEALRNELHKRNIRLDLLVGRGTRGETSKGDAGELEWAIRLPTLYLAEGRICWQPFGKYVRDASLVIVTQENKLLYNHWLIIKRRPFRLAFWGHGANLQSDNPFGLRERFKRWTTRQVDWWFAYTRLSADLVERAGFPRERITVLNNSIDTQELQRLRASMTSDEASALCLGLGMDAGPVAVFIGSLHADKRLDFLFAAADRIRAKIPGFSLLIIGDGPQRSQVADFCAQRPWARWVGAKYGREKALFLSIADVILNPGLVGLSLLDGFVLQLPMFTTQCSLHSPEISYLENGVNGVITKDDVDAYSYAVTTALNSPTTLANLSMGCVASAAEYSIENMVTRFTEGIHRVLE